jgi:hypothetical protein
VENLIPAVPQAEVLADRGLQRTLFAGGGEPTVTGAQANLRLPGDGANRFGQPLEPRLQGLADAGRIPVAPGALDQYPPGTFVAGQCETGTPNPLAVLRPASGLLLSRRLTAGGDWIRTSSGSQVPLSVELSAIARILDPKRARGFFSQV